MRALSSQKTAPLKMVTTENDEHAAYETADYAPERQE